MYSNIWAEYITSFTKQPSQDCVSRLMKSRQVKKRRLCCSDDCRLNLYTHIDAL